MEELRPLMRHSAPMRDNTTLYDRDFHAWANEKARLLREGPLSEADTLNISEVFESMGRGEKRERVSRLTALLLHLLNWQFQPSHRRRPWRLSIANAREQLADHLDENLSLKSQIDAAKETGVSVTTFPAACPWGFEQEMDEGLCRGQSNLALKGGALVFLGSVKGECKARLQQLEKSSKHGIRHLDVHENIGAIDSYRDTGYISGHGQHPPHHCQA